ncbi:hypothetical protein VCRA2123E342_50305 [Vibrio crassostreae]|nr:hypothetical protein VCRA2123E342_50305 [Vibrio crassostreae]
MVIVLQVLELTAQRAAVAVVTVLIHRIRLHTLLMGEVAVVQVALVRVVLDQVGRAQDLLLFTLQQK